MRALKVIGWFFIGLALLMLVTCTSQMWLLQVPFYLVVGWGGFLLRVLPAVTFRWGAIAETLAVGAVLGVGTHLFLRWLWRQLRPEADARPWPVRWSVSLVALLVLFFGATMATVGIGHHVGWLASGRAPLVESSWRFMPFLMERDSSELCMAALRLSKAGVSDARMAQALLRSAELRARAEQRHVVPLHGPGGEAGFLVFPRDPVTRERVGGVRCGGGLHREETFPVAELPRLLSQGGVAAGTTP
jgi:hypothetical protein